MAVAIDSQSDVFKFYENGIIRTDCCTGTDLDFAMLIVGYGYDYGIGNDYYIVKNSWGIDWGDQGYAYFEA